MKPVINEQFTIPIYHGKLAVMFVEGETEVKWYYDDHGEDWKITHAHYMVVKSQTPLPKRVNLIAFNLKDEGYPITHGTVTHEVLHAAFGILNYNGVLHNSDSEEAFTYLAEWISNKVYEIIKKHNIKISYEINVYIPNELKKWYGLKNLLRKP